MATRIRWGRALGGLVGAYVIFLGLGETLGTLLDKLSPDSLRSVQTALLSAAHNLNPFEFSSVVAEASQEPVSSGLDFGKTIDDARKKLARGADTVLPNSTKTAQDVETCEQFAEGLPVPGHWAASWPELAKPFVAIADALWHTLKAGSALQKAVVAFLFALGIGLTLAVFRILGEEEAISFLHILPWGVVFGGPVVAVILQKVMLETQSMLGPQMGAWGGVGAIAGFTWFIAATKRVRN